MNVSSYDGMDTSIRKLSIDAGESSSKPDQSSASQWSIMTSMSSSLTQALDEDTYPAHAVTPCPSDASCCTDCGVSSSSSYAGNHNNVSWDQQNGEIPTEVQMTQQQFQQSHHRAQKPKNCLSVVPQSPPSNAAINTAASAVADNSSSSENSQAQKRRQFLVLVQIILKCLKQQDPSTNNAVTFHAKKVIRECTQRNRQGDPNFASLVDAATPRLRKVVGEKTWRRSILLLKHYIMKQQQQQQQKVAAI